MGQMSHSVNLHLKNRSTVFFLSPDINITSHFQDEDTPCGSNKWVKKVLSSSSSAPHYLGQRAEKNLMS